MRVALFSDIHGNAPALQAVLADSDAQGVNALWVLGDVLGYGPLPITCINMLTERSPAIWLAGNHDLGALLIHEGANIDDSRLRYLAPGIEERQILAWHATQLKAGATPESEQQLRQFLTWQRVNDDVYAAHGAILSADQRDLENVGPNALCHPWAPVADVMLETILQLDSQNRPRLIVVGHTHRPTLGKANQWQKPRSWEWEDGTELYEQEDGWRKLPESTNCPAIICPGSVGQPRFVSGDKRAAYALVDFEQYTVHFRRVVYNEGEFRAAMALVPRAESFHRLDWWRTAQNILAEWHL